MTGRVRLAFETSIYCANGCIDEFRNVQGMGALVKASIVVIGFLKRMMFCNDNLTYVIAL